MARPKRTSTVLESAYKRLAGLHSITPPDFGVNLKLADYETQIGQFGTLLDSYNQMVSALDDMQNQVNAKESSLRELNKRMLAAAEAHYGPDSSQYEQAGGTRQSERKARTRISPGQARELTTLSDRRRRLSRPTKITTCNSPGAGTAGSGVAPRHRSRAPGGHVANS